MEGRRRKENESEPAFLPATLTLSGIPQKFCPGDRIVGILLRIPLPCPVISHLVILCDLEKYSFFGMTNQQKALIPYKHKNEMEQHGTNKTGKIIFSVSGFKFQLSHWLTWFYVMWSNTCMVFWNKEDNTCKVSSTLPDKENGMQ